MVRMLLTGRTVPYVSTGRTDVAKRGDPVHLSLWGKLVRCSTRTSSSTGGVDVTDRPRENRQPKSGRVPAGTVTGLL